MVSIPLRFDLNCFSENSESESWSFHPATVRFESELALREWGNMFPSRYGSI